WLWTGRQLQDPKDRSGERWLSDDELVAAAQKLGRKTLLEILGGHIPSDDPDMKFGDWRMGTGAGGMIVTFLLQQAPRLLEKEDSAWLLRQGATDLLPSAWWSIASAHLDPEHGDKILLEALQHFQGDESGNAYRREELALALWKSAGLRQKPTLVDWFYSE